jgi:Family of unknown function (DUF6454)
MVALRIRDKAQRKGYLQEFSVATGEPLRSVDVATGDRFHPGGLSADGPSLWVPVAEYRRDSSSVIQKRSVRTLGLQYEFDVADHIGCIAVAPGALIGANWDSRDCYVWDHAGRLLRKVPKPDGERLPGHQVRRRSPGRLGPTPRPNRCHRLARLPFAAPHPARHQSWAAFRSWPRSSATSETTPGSMGVTSRSDSLPL